MSDENIKEFHIVNLFWTFQGEGYNSGRRALFVRMPFCNLSCEWCDTEFNKYQKVSVSDFVKYAVREKSKFAVITGGEPTLHKHTFHIINLLHLLGFEVACESNGTVQSKIYSMFDFVTISPKRQSKYKGMSPYYVSDAALEHASEFKYVVDKDFDFSILDRHEQNSTKKLYLSPEFNDFKESLNKIYSYIERNPGWKISLQTHKWMGID